MPFLPILAQEAQPSFWDSLFSPPTHIYGQQVAHAPIVAIPVFLLILAVVSFVIERVAAWFVQRFAKKTATQVDDVFVESLPRLIRTVLLFVALHVVVQALVRDPARADTAMRVIRAIGIVAIGIVATRIALRMTDAWVEGRPQMRPVGPGIKLALKVAVIPVLLVTVLQTFGIEIAAFLTVLGVGSLAVALALQDVLKNIFSGIQLVLDQPIRAGDFVSMDDGKVRGTVLEVGLRSTKLRTVDNNVVIVPNATLANAVVTNMDVVDRTHLHTVVVGAGYDSDSRRVQAVLEETARALADGDERFTKDPPVVAFREFGDSALVFALTVRLRTFADRGTAGSELNHRILERFRAEGIEIAFPTRTVIVRQEPPKAA